ncbi:hypothetical protein X922_17395 [Pseudomonas aeruginosa VRFPA08]|nr:hypothetical protein [Pseudomonas aeruginosa]ETD46657.1 hypothetical protein X922_17395 [Pseudomonas aeruginosa VRFPA08]
MGGDQFLGQVLDGVLVALLGRFDQGATGVIGQLSPLAQLAVADAHAGHGFQGFFAESAEIGDVTVNLINRTSQEVAELLPGSGQLFRTVRIFLT